MILYHGSNMIVSQPKLVHQNRTLDFGYGFYTTTNQNQAVNFAAKVANRRGIGSPCVSMYEVANLEELTSKYKVLIFPGPNEEWLDFVFANRNGSYNGEHYDIIFGPVANDTIYQTFVAYEAGILTKEETIARLKVKKLFNQMTFTTESALKELKYIGQFVMESGRNE
ncbi:MAG: hypothetical protein JG769_1063 [Oscillospiraceae bacterium]|jgi:hypothetical protein|nr:hypothetical protein [Oscillospiraceae bacterium]